ncbi:MULTISPECIES: LytR/AlgR family response regulator transcription factor [unclassified Carboxylicivirga]|uniref:LytR/AlgR family response regulator transcription factor n=1 Tax=Carboxylicivirga TaxID=1628153 RepID=UPI003D34DE64
MKLKHILETPFDLLDSFKSRLFFVLFITNYIILFLLIYRPYNLEQWYIFSDGNKTLSFLVLGLIGGAFYALSQLLIRSFLNFKQFTLKHFALWTIVEILILTAILTIIYDAFNGLLNSLLEFFSNLRYIFITLVLPYSFSLVILSLFKSRTEIIELRRANQSSSHSSNTLIRFPDENGNVKVSILSDDVLYLVSTDNYINIYYLNDEQVRTELIRNSLKNLEAYLDVYPIERCHRSYMINVDKISMIKKSGSKLKAKLNNAEVMIPISKTYRHLFDCYLLN